MISYNRTTAKKGTKKINQGKNMFSKYIILTDAEDHNGLTCQNKMEVK